MADGWDDDDLDVELSEDQETDGWGDDEDLEDLVESVAAPVPAPMPMPAPAVSVPMPAPAPMPMSNLATEDQETDGWGDDEDLGDLDDDVAAPAPTPAPAPMPLSNLATEDQETDGWGDDEGLEDLVDSVAAPVQAPMPMPAPAVSVHMPAPAPVPMSNLATEDQETDGWGDDEDLEDLDDVSTPASAPSPSAASAPLATVPTPMPAPAPASLVNDGGWVSADDGDFRSVDDGDFRSVDDGADGWQDDTEDLNLDDEAMGWGDSSATRASIGAVKDSVGDDNDAGWAEDEDLFSDAVETEAPMTPGGLFQQHQHDQKVDNVHQELVQYVEALMIQLPSVNAVLEAEYNSPEKAHELLHYYTERPQLRQYTIEKEVPRMDYRVVLQHDEHEPIIVDSKEEILQLFKLQPSLDLMVRCANQSLLADLLQVLTSPDGMVRPQYMATCLAESCQFVLRPRQGTQGGLVECNSQLVLSLPEPSGGRCAVADLQVSVAFGIPAFPQSEQPMIQFKLQQMNIILPSMDILRPIAQFLLESGLLDHPPISPFPESPGGKPISDSGDFRDMFLQQSQNMLQNSTVGLKSAWKQFDSVAGFESKMNMMKKILPTGNQSVLEDAMKEQEAYQQQMLSQGGPPNSMPTSASPTSYPTTIQQPQQQQRHQQQQRQQQQKQEIPQQQRPTSILGSVFGRLAKTVALPDEDPSFYEEYAHRQRAASADGGQHQPASAQESFVHLYRKDSLKPQQEEPASRVAPKKQSPWLSQLTEPTPPVAAPVPDPVALPIVQTSAPTTPGDDNIMEASGEDENLGLDDGWDDDVDLAFDELEVQTNVTSNVSTPRSHTEPRDTPASGTFSSPSTVAPNKNSVSKTTLPQRYGPEDDIIKTRKRWVNPKPGYRQLRPVLS